MTLMKLKMPKLRTPVRVGILLHKGATPTIPLLMRDIFGTANQVLKESRYQIDLLSVRGGKMKLFEVSIETKKASPNLDVLFVSPFDRLVTSELDQWKSEAQYIHSIHQKKIQVATSCLGSILLAQSGILTGKEATTHWGVLDFVRTEFPTVNWNTKNMICHSPGIVTAGGFLAVTDLVLHFISETSGKKIAHEVGRLLLAESSRQNQSVYATSLVSQKEENSPFCNLEARIEKSLSSEISVEMMAKWSGMSLRNFQRQFSAVYGVSPKAYIQLKRIEHAKMHLRNTKLSLASVLEKIGVSDISSFRKLFQREIGMTPAEFRKRIHGVSV